MTNDDITFFSPIKFSPKLHCAYIWAPSCPLPYHLVKGPGSWSLVFPMVTDALADGELRLVWCHLSNTTLMMGRTDVPQGVPLTVGLATCCCSRGHGLSDQSPEIAECKSASGSRWRVSWGRWNRCTLISHWTNTYWKPQMAKALKRLEDLKVNNSLCCQKCIILVRWKQLHTPISITANMTNWNLTNWTNLSNWTNWIP